MPSPFPGMDPFIERQEWEDFHTTFNTVIREWLSPRVEPKYLVRVEHRVYVEHPGDEDYRLRRCDVAVLLADPMAATHTSPRSTASAAIAPVECLLPLPDERRETFLVVRERDTMEVVTIVETLSPANKRPGGDGRREYLEKREQVLNSHAHLVELDLLRDGQRLPLIGPQPPGDYYAIVSRRQRRPRADVYAWTLRQPLPPIPIPLKPDDADVWLDLQAVFSTVYDRARYDLSLNYYETLAPPAGDVDAAWIGRLLPGTDPAPPL